MIDASFRVAYRVAHALLRGYWYLARPQTRGALVALWHRGEILLVRSSYRADFTLPGGYVEPGEQPIDAAARELLEETGIDAGPPALRHAYHGVHLYEYRHDEIDIFEIEVDERPNIRVDGREVIWADFRTPTDARAMRIVPHLQDYLAGR